MVSLLITFAWISLQSIVNRPGLIIYDFFQKQFPNDYSEKIALILIDSPTIDSLAREQSVFFPFPRSLYKEFLQSARELGANGIGFDIIFSEPSARGPEDDLAFATGISESGIPVVVASGDHSNKPNEILMKAKNLSWGDASTVNSTDGIFREINPSAETFTGQLFLKTQSGVLPKHSGLIHFALPSSIQTESFYNVLLTANDPKLKIDLQQKLKSKIWIVAYSAPGLFDIRPTPTDAQSAGVFIHANLLSEYLKNQTGMKSIHTLGSFYLITFLLIFWFFTIVFLNPQRPIVLFILSFSFTFLLPFLISISAWRYQNTWIDPIGFSIAMLLGTGAHFLYKIRRDWAERLTFAKTIQNSMSAGMLQLIETGEVEVTRFGEKREICILFADLAGFTTLSEQLTPEKLFELMNEYLDSAVSLILDRNGYVDKFIGDAVMALWGAPVKALADADSALAASLGFASVTHACQKRWKEQYGLDFPIYARVGLHFGEAMVGNLGSKDRFNYTALGDAVNLASRLEGAGKQYGQLITASGEIIAKCSSPYLDRPPSH